MVNLKKGFFGAYAEHDDKTRDDPEIRMVLEHLTGIGRRQIITPKGDIAHERMDNYRTRLIRAAAKKTPAAIKKACGRHTKWVLAAIESDKKSRWCRPLGSNLDAPATKKPTGKAANPLTGWWHVFRDLDTAGLKLTPVEVHPEDIIGLVDCRARVADGTKYAWNQWPLSVPRSSLVHDKQLLATLRD